ncbi:MAG: hypothetical protein WCF36_12720 [Candidatus Nanopelagicales bacterium]
MARFMARLATPFSIVLLGCAVMTGGVASPTSAADGGFDRTDRDSVERAWLEANPMGRTIDPGWTGSIASCTAGSVNPEMQQAVVKAINFYRVLAGLDPVALDPGLSGLAQEAALVFGAGGAVQDVHTILPTDPCYTSGAALAARSSNVSFGTMGLMSLVSYMQSSSHRPWILYPPTRLMGSGYVSVSEWKQYNALWVVPWNDPSGAAAAPAGSYSNPEWVSWPPAAAQTPADLLRGNWSLTSYNAGVDFSGAAVTVVGPGGQEFKPTPWVRPPGWAAAVYWSAQELGSPGENPGIYDVTVSGVTRDGVALPPVRYQVNSFQPRVPAAPTAPTTPSPTQNPPPATPVVVKVKATNGKSKLYVDVNPNKGSGYWKFQVQKQRVDGHWKPVKTYKTKGSKETRTINLPKGTYRVVVRAKYNYAETTSTPVTLKR